MYFRNYEHLDYIYLESTNLVIQAQAKQEFSHRCSLCNLHSYIYIEQSINYQVNCLFGLDLRFCFWGLYNRDAFYKIIKKI